MNYERHFEESAPYAMWVKILLPATLLAVIALFLSFAGIISFFSKITLVMLVFLVVVLVLSLWLFFTVRFGADSKSVYAKTGPFCYKIDKRNIVETRIINKIPFWAGWGIRVWWWDSLTLAFATSHGSSIMFVKKSGFFKRVVFSVSDPREFARKSGLKISSKTNSA